jgi:ABC-type glycerol-3-phosphate transport system substrate-binding protein
MFVRRISIACTAACILLAGCQSGPKEEVYSRAMEEFAHGELTVAYVNYGNTGWYDMMIDEITSVYRNLMINSQAYASKNEFITDVTTQLNAGNGPDLFLLDFATPLSFQKMARNDTYADLTPYLEADSRFTASDYDAFEAGQINGKQYLLPITYSTFALYTTEENLKKLNLTADDFSDAEKVLAALETATDYVEKDASLIPIFPEMSRNDVDSFWIDAFDLPVLDFDSKEVVIDKDFYKRAADLSRRIGESFLDTHAQRSELFSDPETLENSLFVLTNLDKDGWAYYQYYTRMDALGQTAVRIPLPSYQDATQIAGYVNLYATVNSNSKNRLLAYETVRIIMDYPWNTYGGFNGSVLTQKAAFQKSLMGLGGGYQIPWGDEMLTIKEPAAVRNQILEESTSVQVCDLNSAAIVSETIGEYVYGRTDDFDGCWENLMNRLTLYLTE